MASSESARPIDSLGILRSDRGGGFRAGLEIPGASRLRAIVSPDLKHERVFYGLREPLGHWNRPVFYEAALRITRDARNS